MVITTSPNERQLNDNLWGEIRRAGRSAPIPLGTHIPGSTMKIEYKAGKHRRLIRGMTPERIEGGKGYHSQHGLLIVDEAAGLTVDKWGALETITSSGDWRVLLLFNPTHDDSVVADLLRGANLTDDSTGLEIASDRPGFTEIVITAFDTPNLSHLTNQQVEDRWGETSLPEGRQPIKLESPPGAALITAEHLDYLVATGRGPGDPHWENNVMARFDTAGGGALVSGPDYDRAIRSDPPSDAETGSLQFGVDLGGREGGGEGESILTIRQGLCALDVHNRTRMEAEEFLIGVVGPLFRKLSPTHVVYDAEGPGAGVPGLCRDLFGECALPFRGSMKVGGPFYNLRSMWYLHLATRFRTSQILLSPRVHHSDLRRVLTNIQYGRSETGSLKLESKNPTIKRLKTSMDRADSLMYAFAFLPPEPVATLDKPDKPQVELERDKDPTEMTGGEIRERRRKKRNFPSRSVPTPFA